MTAPDTSQKAENAQPAGLSLVAARDAVAAGHLTARDLVDSCLDRIAEHEPRVGAWQVLDAAAARAHADAIDDRHATAPSAPNQTVEGLLTGVPIGVKDIIDTVDFPTENGTAVQSGRQPQADAWVVARLREAGAIIIGKTVTTELAVFGPGKTANPHDPTRTPGGSSSGSAAAVACGMVPGALGTQTAGSILRPASFCGVVGFKPTFGRVPRTGCLTQSPPLDTIGPMTRTVRDAALLADVLSGTDDTDPDTWLTEPSQLLAAVSAAPPNLAPRLLPLRGPHWADADAAARATFDAFCEQQAELIVAPDATNDAGLTPADWAAQRTLQWADIARYFVPLFGNRIGEATAKLREMMADGAKISADDYEAAKQGRKVLADRLDDVLAKHNADAFVTLAAPGAAPLGLGATGSPVFNALATYVGAPAISLPILQADGLPLGLQLIGRRYDDSGLLTAADRVERRCAAAQSTDPA